MLRHDFAQTGLLHHRCQQRGLPFLIVFTPRGLERKRFRKNQQNKIRATLFKHQQSAATVATQTLKKLTTASISTLQKYAAAVDQEKNRVNITTTASSLSKHACNETSKTKQATISASPPSPVAASLPNLPKLANINTSDSMKIPPLQTQAITPPMPIFDLISQNFLRPLALNFNTARSTPKARQLPTLNPEIPTNLNYVPATQKSQY